MVHFKSGGRIWLTGGEKVVIMVKSWFKGWRKYFRWFEERSHLYDSSWKRSWITAGKRLQKFERTYRVHFCFDKKSNEVIFKRRGGD